MGGEPVVEGGEFGGSEEKSFTVSAPPFAPPTSQPIPAPTPQPIFAPTPQPIPACSEDSDCDDGNPDTNDTCDSGSCQHSCATHTACDDNDACTEDVCTTEGICTNTHNCALCGGGVSSVLELTTDNYPSETAWKVTDSDGQHMYEGSGYSDKNTLHTINMCLLPDEYTYSITDAYGNGICCSHGNGGYVIKVGGEPVVEGG